MMAVLAGKASAAFRARRQRALCLEVGHLRGRFLHLWRRPWYVTQAEWSRDIETKKRQRNVYRRSCSGDVDTYVVLLCTRRIGSATLPRHDVYLSVCRQLYIYFFIFIFCEYDILAEVQLSHQCSVQLEGYVNLRRSYLPVSRPVVASSPHPSSNISNYSNHTRYVPP